MPVFSKIRNFFWRNRNKFIVGGILVTSSILLTKYAQQKLKEWQEKEMLEFLERTRKQQHFENIGRTCNQTIVNLLVSLTEALNKTIDTDSLVANIRANPDDKVANWESLKILLISKLCCLIYSISMLVVILRIQLNLVGGYLFKKSNSIPTDIQEKYLSLTQTFLNDGLNEISERITKICKKVIEPIDLKKQMRLCDIDALLWSLQTAIGDDGALDKMNHYLLGKNTDINVENCDDTYNLLLRDTLDLLESDEVKGLLSQCINKGFILVANQISSFYPVGTKVPHSNNSTSAKDDFNPKIPLAKLLPIINGLLIKKSFPDEFMQQLVSYEKLQIFGANIYESLL